MLYKIAVCDDERTMLHQLSSYLTRMQEETGAQYDIFYFTSAEELLASMPANVQVILLDIAMGNMTGMECAKTLRAKDCKADIVFITNMTEYALEGYDVHAFAFIPKPVVYTEFKQKLTACFAHARHESKAIFPVDTAGGKELLPIDEIIFAEVYQHETSFVLSDRSVTGAIPLSEAEKLLMTYGFFRCHRCYIVNMANIRRIDQDKLTMNNGKVIPVSKHRRKNFLDAFANFMGGRFV